MPARTLQITACGIENARRSPHHGCAGCLADDVCGRPVGLAPFPLRQTTLAIAWQT